MYISGVPNQRRNVAIRRTDRYGMVTYLGKVPFNVGPWRVQSATHKVTGKRVSVWSTDKRSQEMERMGQVSRDRTLEVLKAEVNIPDILFSMCIHSVGICTGSSPPSFHSR